MTDRVPGTKFVLFAVVCAIAAGWIASVSGNIEVNRIIPTILPFLDDANEYFAELNEASGLVVGDDVRIAGVDVGRVNGIALEEGVAIVEFEVLNEVVPTTEWQSGARWRNAIGQRFLYLYPNPGGVDLNPGDAIPVENSVDVADLAAFVNQVTPLLEAIDPASQNKLTQALNDTLIGREADIQNLVVNLAELADTVAAEEPEIRAVIANANLLLGEYNSRTDDLTGFIDQLSLVANTLANRNGELLDAAIDITRVQQELGRLIDTNDDRLVSSLDNLEQITQRIGRQRGAFEDTLASLRQGLASYMLTSRNGQWFDVRGTAVQVQMNGQVASCTTETGTTCAFPNDPRSGGGQQATATSGPAASSADELSMSPERLDAIQVVTGVPLLRLDQLAQAEQATAEGQG